MGFRVPEIVLQPNIYNNIVTENVCIFATLQSRNREMLWSLMKFYPTWFCLCCIDTKMKTENDNVMVIEYEIISRTYINVGFFFELHFENNFMTTLYIRFCDVNLENITNQIKMLCIGEEGPTYKGATGFCTGERIIIRYYKNNKQNCYNDYQYILASSSLLGHPKKGMVSTTREYGREAEIMVSMRDETFEREIIGNIIYDDIFNDIPTGSFTVLDCGLIYKY